MEIMETLTKTYQFTYTPCPLCGEAKKPLTIAIINDKWKTLFRTNESHGIFNFPTLNAVLLSNAERGTIHVTQPGSTSTNSISLNEFFDIIQQRQGNPLLESNMKIAALDVTIDAAGYEFV